MSDFSDAIAVLDTIATIANDVTKTRYNYVIDNKRAELQEEKWEHQKDTAEFNQNNALLNDYQENINSNMTAEAYDDAYKSMKEFSGTLTNPKLQEKAQTMLDSKTQIGQVIDSKDAWQANVERIFAEYEGIQDEFKSDNFSGTNHMIELAKEMRAGVLANQKFFDSADNSRFERMGKEIENYADAASYISQYDADSDLEKFDIELGYQEFPVIDAHTGQTIGNEYERIMHAVDLLKTGNVNEAMMAARKIPDRYGNDLRQTIKPIMDHRKAVMKGLYNNLDVTETENARTNPQGKRLTRIRHMWGINNDYNAQLNNATTKQEREAITARRAEDMDNFRQSNYMHTDKGQVLFDEDLAIINNGLFNEEEYNNWNSATTAAMNAQQSKNTAVLEGKVVEARKDYKNALTVAIDDDNLTIEGGIKDIIKAKSLDLYPEVTSVQSAIAGSPRINRYDEAIAGPIRLLEGVFTGFMGEEQEVGLIGSKNLYTENEMAVLRNESKDPSVQRNRQRTAYRVYNNIFWGGAQTQDEVAEQLGSDFFSGKGSGTIEKGGLELIRQGQTYYNEMFTNKLISEYTYGGHQGQAMAISDVQAVTKHLLTERKGIKRDLASNQAFDIHTPDGLDKMTDRVYMDVLGSSENPVWKDMVREAYVENILHTSPIYKLEYWQNPKLTSIEIRDKLITMHGGTEAEASLFAEEFKKADLALKQQMLEQRMYEDVPSFLK